MRPCVKKCEQRHIDGKWQSWNSKPDLSDVGIPPDSEQHDSLVVGKHKATVGSQRGYGGGGGEEEEKQEKEEEEMTAKWGRERNQEVS